MTLSDHHRHLNADGIGKCSVPMWMGGCPAGFCDNDAYGAPLPAETYRTSWGEIKRWDGRPVMHISGLACPQHGGPKTRVYKDGSAWCAVHPDFINLQESPAGFGDTPEAARKALEQEPTP